MRRNFCLVPLFCLALEGSLPAQTKRRLTYDDILRMVNAGIDKDTIRETIRSSKTAIGDPAAAQPDSSGDEMLLPAGMLLYCTLHEPGFSSRTARIDDPVLCSAQPVRFFGRVMFPRGAYLGGHLAEYRDPGRLIGKGWMTLEFDRLILPNAAVPLTSKVISVRGFRVDADGRVLGHGHAKRDALEWAIPPLWPAKLAQLPRRGPRPTLKGEVSFTVRLLEDASIPREVSRVSGRLTSAELVSENEVRNTGAVGDDPVKTAQIVDGMR